LEFLPVPTFSHQDLVIYLFERLNAFIGRRTPREVYVAPFRVRVATGNIREPDVAYIRAWRIQDRKAAANGADLVMEVVSADPRDHERDYSEKRNEYAATGIPEYWIVDPQLKIITVLVIDGHEYKVHGEFKPGSTATSASLPGFEINVGEAFAAAQME
jgi:Uma2 family endonuclease